MTLRQGRGNDNEIHFLSLPSLHHREDFGFPRNYTNRTTKTETKLCEVSSNLKSPMPIDKWPRARAFIVCLVFFLVFKFECVCLVKFICRSRIKISGQTWTYAAERA